MKLLIINEEGLCVNAIEADYEDPKFLPNNHTYALDHSNGGIGWSFIGGAWVEPEIENKLETFEELSDRFRIKRNNLLFQTDWIVVKSYEIGETISQEWLDYRQALRDIPTQEGFPYSVTWPTKPE